MGEPLRQTEYLCHGELRQWPGPLQEVISPVTLPQGEDTAVVVGWYPLLTQQQAQDALAAACQAYDSGRGRWPTMSIEERIGCVEQFAYRIKEQRSRLVTLLMWEIGKSRPDAEKEFDRTMAPAVMFPVTPTMKLFSEEQFGPLVPVAEYSDIQEPMNYVTASDYGQQVSLFGNDPEQLTLLIDTLVNQVCRVNINSQCQRGPDSFPFTGRKDSAEGTLSVADALRAFSIRSLVAAKETDANRKIIKAVVTGRKSRFLSTDFIL